MGDNYSPDLYLCTRATCVHDQVTGRAEGQDEEWNLVREQESGSLSQVSMCQDECGVEAGG